MNFCVRMVVVMSFVVFSCRGMESDPVQDCCFAIAKEVQSKSKSLLGLQSKLVDFLKIVTNCDEGLISKRWEIGYSADGSRGTYNILHCVFESMRGGKKLLGDDDVLQALSNVLRVIQGRIVETSGPASWNKLLEEEAPRGGTPFGFFNTVFELTLKHNKALENGTPQDQTDYDQQLKDIQTLLTEPLPVATIPSTSDQTQQEQQVAGEAKEGTSEVVGTPQPLSTPLTTSSYWCGKILLGVGGGITVIAGIAALVLRRMASSVESVVE